MGNSDFQTIFYSSQRINTKGHTLWEPLWSDYAVYFIIYSTEVQVFLTLQNG